MSQGGANNSTGSGSGNVVGPGTSTNRAIPTFNGTNGQLLFNNPSATIDSNGYYSNTNQPSFRAVVGTDIPSATGDGTQYTIIFDTVLFDTTSSYNNTTGVYTFPKTGKYLINATCMLYNVDLTHEIANLNINVQGVELASQLYPAILATNTGICTLPCMNGIFAANAADTCFINVLVSGGAKDVGISGLSGIKYFTNFSIQLLS